MLQGRGQRGPHGRGSGKPRNVPRAFLTSLHLTSVAPSLCRTSTFTFMHGVRSRSIYCGFGGYHRPRFPHNARGRHVVRYPFCNLTLLARRVAVLDGRLAMHQKRLLSTQYAEHIERGAENTSAFRQVWVAKRYLLLLCFSLAWPRGRVHCTCNFMSDFVIDMRTICIFIGLYCKLKLFDIIHRPLVQTVESLLPCLQRSVL